MTEVPDEVLTGLQNVLKASQSKEAEEARRAELEKEIDSRLRLKGLEDDFEKVDDRVRKLDLFLVEIKTSNTWIKWSLGGIGALVLLIVGFLFRVSYLGLLHPPG